MSGGMAEIIAAHSGYGAYPDEGVDAWHVECDGCDWREQLTYGNTDQTAHAAHVAEELAKAGYGDVRKASRGPMQDAWEYGWAAGVLDATVPDRRKSSNPYGEFSANRLRGVAK